MTKLLVKENSKLQYLIQPTNGSVTQISHGQASFTAGPCTMMVPLIYKVSISTLMTAEKN